MRSPQLCFYASVLLLPIACFRSLDDLSSGTKITNTSAPAETSPEVMVPGPLEPQGVASCRDAALVCNNQSCCESSTVSGGSYTMGPDQQLEPMASSYERPAHRATVQSFGLDRYEVTVGRFRRFLQEYGTSAAVAGVGAHPRIANSGWNPAWNSALFRSKKELQEALFCDPYASTWTDKPGDFEKKPINCITWYEAFLFCAWDGGRLPTEAEWEYAAGDGDRGTRFPWGNTIEWYPDARGSNYAVLHCNGVLSSGPCGVDDIGDVGSKVAGANRWGHLDLAGNLNELVLDSFADDWYARGECNDCANLEATETTERKVTRGGDFTSTEPSFLYRFRRSWTTPVARQPTTGFRCAR